MPLDPSRVAACTTLEQLNALYSASPAQDRRQLWEYLFDRYSRRFQALLADDLDAGHRVILDAFLADDDATRIPVHYRQCLPKRLRRLVAVVNEADFPVEEDSLFVESRHFRALDAATRRQLQRARHLSLPLLMMSVGEQSEGHVFTLKFSWIEATKPALQPSLDMLTVTLDEQFCAVLREAEDHLCRSKASVAIYWSITGDSKRRRDLTRLEGRSACAALHTGIDVILDSVRAV
jgi:hypothetical protein